MIVSDCCRRLAVRGIVNDVYQGMYEQVPDGVAASQHSPTESVILDMTCAGCAKSQRIVCSAAPQHMPSDWLCTPCRIEAADPCWKVVSVVMPQTRKPNIPNEVPDTQLEMSVRCAFELSSSQAHQAKSADSSHQLHLLCFQRGDPIAHRIHWPLHCELILNGRLLNRPYERPADAKMADGERDGPVADLAPILHQGRE